MSFGNEIKTGNISENWLFDIFSNNSCLQFDGADDFVDCGSTDSSSGISLTSSNKISVVFWVQFLNDGTADQIFASNMPTSNNYQGWWIRKDASTNAITFNWGDNTGTGSGNRETMTGSVALSAGTWYGVAITSDFSLTASNTKIYTYNLSTGSITANTVTNSGTAGITTPTYGTGKAYFGRYGSTPDTSYGNFKIKTFAVWSGELDVTNLSAIVEGGLGKSWLNNFGNYTSASSLVGFWDFTKSSEVVQDVIGGLDGTIYEAKMIDFIPVAFSDVTNNNVFYRGAVLNKPSLRESIDLNSSTSKNSNLSITVSDFTYNGDGVSKELVNFSTEANKYLNQTLTAYISVNEQQKIQVGQFRIDSIARDKDKITISTVSFKPWDNIKFPQSKTTDENLYVPVTYGSYNGNGASTISSPKSNLQLTSMEYKPVEFNKLDSGFALYPIDRSESGGGRLAHYVKEYDIFVPISDSETNMTEVDGAFHARTLPTCRYVYKAYAKSVEQYDTGSNDNSTTITNIANVSDGDDSTFATIDTGVVSETRRNFGYTFYIKTGKGDNRFVELLDSGTEIASSKIQTDATLQSTLTESGGINSSLQTFDISDSTNLVVDSPIKIGNEIMVVTAINSSTNITVERGRFNTESESHDINSPIFTSVNYDILNYKYEVSGTFGSNCILVVYISFGGDRQIRRGHSSNQTVNDSICIPAGVEFVRIFGEWFSPNPSGGTINADLKLYDISVTSSRDFRDPPKKLYIASEGLTHGRTDLNGNAIQYIEDAHLDLLHRFGGVNTNVNFIDGWIGNVENRNWSIRSWDTKPVSLKNKLEKLQYEGGFIFRYKMSNGKPQYIGIKDSYSSSDYTLTKNDITDVSVNPLSMSSVFTQMNINYQKHPTGDRYIVNQESKDAVQRNRFRIQEKENITEVNLDAYVSPTIPSSASTTPTDDFYSYYHNIFGSHKLVVTGKIVNPKFYNIEVGDIVNFEDRPFDFFNTTDITESLRWDDTVDNYEDIEDLWDQGGGVSGDDKYFMITSIQRRIGVLTFEAREVG